ncbi:MAG: hypothetical protein RBT78_04445 [Kiritimatiellia bacterium]|jgi:hypothetical protein|nr:hypothetical protein [Kiritimatiellia bacterium]
MKRAYGRSGAALFALAAAGQVLMAHAALHIGGRRELFADEAMIGGLSGDARQVLHRPVRREIVFETNRPWEGNGSGYQSVIHADGRYRMYYRAFQYGKRMGGPDTPFEDHEWYLCYAESTDGINWVRPELDLVAFRGSKKNNIILDGAGVRPFAPHPACTAVFYDTCPVCPPDQRYKLVLTNEDFRDKEHLGMYIMVSGDGIRFRMLSRERCVTDGIFDSQNTIFWDPVIRQYRAYYRYFKGGYPHGTRDILTSASPDILHFPPGKPVRRKQGEEYALYTNQMQPYYRAPHIILGFPMRYVDRGADAWEWPAMQALPGQANRRTRFACAKRYGTAVTDAVLLVSRDGESVRLWEEAFLRPGPRLKESWVYGDNFVFWGMVETASQLGDAPNEISFYSTEGYWEGSSTRFRRSTLRLDGFVSVQASARGGGVTTVPLIFEGRALSINFETSAVGELRVEIQNPDGTPVPGYSMEECFPIFGDHIGFTVAWKGKGTDVSALAGKPVRIRYEIRDADLYAFQFVK